MRIKILRYEIYEQDSSSSPTEGSLVVIKKKKDAWNYAVEIARKMPKGSKVIIQPRYGLG